MNDPQPTPDEPAQPGFGITRDLHQLKTHGTASVAELREFLTQMRSRSPQEVLGLVAGSDLLRSVAVATVGALLLLAVGSVVPWWLNGLSAGPSKAKPAAASQAAAPASTEPQPAAAQPAEKRPAEPPAAAAADPKPSQADAEKAIQVMGLGDTKSADPKQNPLEKSLDNLLDKLE